MGNPDGGVDGASPEATAEGPPRARLEQLIELGRARGARHDINELPEPAPGPSLSLELAALRERES